MLNRAFRPTRQIRLNITAMTPDTLKPRTGRAALLLVACGVLVWLALIVWAGVARAEDLPGRIMYVCTQEDPLNVRDAPSLHAPWVYRLDRGEAVTVHEIKGGWAYIEWVGQYGWAWAEYLTDKPPADGLPEEFLEVELE